jgi:GNAT superfamily N-acetyltransferase
MDAAEAVIAQCEIEDLPALVRIDRDVTGREKREYWKQLFRILADESIRCLVVRVEGQAVGYIIGEIRAWEFGQEPCGWVFSLAILPAHARAGLGRRLLAALADWFRSRGIPRMRTMVNIEHEVIHRFFRSSGFTSGPYLQLETEIAP